MVLFISCNQSIEGDMATNLSVLVMKSSPTISTLHFSCQIQLRVTPLRNYLSCSSSNSSSSIMLIVHVFGCLNKLYLFDFCRSTFIFWLCMLDLMYGRDKGFFCFDLSIIGGLFVDLDGLVSFIWLQGSFYDNFGGDWSQIGIFGLVAGKSAPGPFILFFRPCESFSVFDVTDNRLFVSPALV